MATPSLYRNMQRTLQRRARGSSLPGGTDIYDFLRSANLLDNLTYDDAHVCGVTAHQMMLVFPKEHIPNILSIGIKDLQLIKHMKKIAASPVGSGMQYPMMYFHWSDLYPLSDWFNLKVSTTQPDDLNTFVDIDVVIEALREEYQSQHP